jgi:hypothetical protein
MHMQELCDNVWSLQCSSNMLQLTCHLLEWLLGGNVKSQKDLLSTSWEDFWCLQPSPPGISQ